MAKAKTRKKKIVTDSSVKSINLFGRPNKGKRYVFLRAQKIYAETMNAFCALLVENNEYYWEILNNSTHSSKLRELEVLCLPDSAKCTLTDKNPLDMDKCPDGHNCCESDCPYYTE